MTTPEWREEVERVVEEFRKEWCIDEVIDGFVQLKVEDWLRTTLTDLLDTERARLVERLEKEIALHKEIIRIHERGVFPKSWHEGKIEAFDHAIDIVKSNV
jgi:hypothetical protein